MTSSTRLRIVAPVTAATPASELALMAPWHANGTLEARQARQLSALAAVDPAVAEDLAAARAEQAAVAAMGEAYGRPSMRPMIALFAAIDAEARPGASNVTRLAVAQACIASRPKKIRRTG